MVEPLTPTTVSFVQDVLSVGPVRSALNTDFRNGPMATGNVLSSAFISYSNDAATWIQSATGVGAIESSQITRYVRYQAQMDNSADTGLLRSMTVETDFATTNFWSPLNGSLRTSKDGVTYTDWMHQVGSTFTSQRYSQFRVEWNPYAGLWPVSVSSVWILLDAPSSTQQATAAVVPAGGTTFAFNPAYRMQPPTIHLTLIAPAAGFPVIIAQGLLAFTVKVFNQAGTDVGGTINWIAEGI